MPSNFQFKAFSEDHALASAAATDWLQLIGKSSGPHTVALSGGRIAKTLFSEIANQAKATGTSLGNVHFFWADERCVPPTDPDSNFLLAQQTLFIPLGIAADKIHRLKGELPPLVAVDEANRDLSRIVSGGGGVPVLDVIFLGLGEDGHIASLMPNATPEVLTSREAYVHVSNSPKPPPNRLTMTYPVLAAARNVWALINGAGKADALRKSLSPEGLTSFGRVLQSRSKTIIYTDLNEIVSERSN